MPDESHQHKSQVQHQFGRAARDYLTSDVHAAGESLVELQRRISTDPRWRALDVATGAGHTAVLFAPQVDQMIATDITDEMLQATQELADGKGIDNLSTQIADAESLPFADDCFDLVTCRLAFHHFPRQTEALSQFHRVLKPGGWIGFTDNFTSQDTEAAEFYNRFETIRDPSHFRVHSIEKLRQMFRQAGFAIIDRCQLSKEFEFHAWADRQRVNDTDKGRLLEMLDDLPEALLPLMQPRKTEVTTYFSLAEIVMVAQKA